MLARWFIKLHVLLYQISGGRILGKIRRMSVLLLTTTGRKTGKLRTTPLGYVQDGDNYVVIGSAGGRETHPAWWLNLKHTPQATIQVGSVRKPVTAEQATGEEEDRLWARVIDVEPAYASYRTNLNREVPVVILRPQD